MKLEIKMTTDELDAEIARQEKCLAQLPGDFDFPLFNSKHAVESQRRSGYRNTAAAAREIVDNAIEAKATRIDVFFEQAKREGKPEKAEKAKGKKAKDTESASVTAVAFLDNGSGMSDKMVRYALSWGAGTHFDELGTIGRFGFGLPNASINQTRRVEVYTKRRTDSQVTKAWLDINDVKDHGVTRIEKPETAELPEFVQRYLKDNDLTFEHGTVVVWVLPDRLSYRKASTLKEHLLDDFGVTYRYMLNGLELQVAGKRVDAVDPFFLTPGTRYYLPEEEGGAIKIFDQMIPVRYYQDEDTGELHLEHVAKANELDPENEKTLAVGALQVRIVRFPPGFSVFKKGKAQSDANRRFEIRKARRGMSFVRRDREIETVDVFPRSMRDINAGLGDWPLLQGYAYHWGIEVRFNPQLDEVFGIANDKQTVRPIEDFWRLLASDEFEIDALLRAENNWQSKERDKKKPIIVESAEPSPAENAAALADRIDGEPNKVPEKDQEKVEKATEEEAKKRVGVTETTIEEAKDAIKKQGQRRAYKIEYYDDPSGANGPFFEPEWRPGNVVVAKVNRQHPFYSAFYAELLGLEGGSRARYALDIVLFALAKAELRIEDPVTKMWNESLRLKQWSPFLSNALKVLEQTARADDPQGDAEGNQEETFEAAE
jgi:Histidine kinase-, DNA gyrase B-, and HSP90-like ATPase